MGRALEGNSVSAAVTELSRTLGNADSVIKDTTTVSNTNLTISPGGQWAYNGSYGTQYAFSRNSVSAQQIQTTSSFGVLQDPLGDYTYVQAYGYYSNSVATSGIVYDSELNQVYGWGQGSGSTRPFTGTLFCVRLHNNNLYFFTGTSTGVNVTKVSLPSGTATVFSSPSLGGNWTNADKNLVFNWPINNKFWMFLSQGSANPYSSQMWTFDITTESFAQYGTTISRTSSNFINQSFALHVKADGSAASAAVYLADGNYGVVRFTSSTGTYTNTGTSGHYQDAYYGTWYVFCNEKKQLSAVTTDCVVDQKTVNYAPGAIYYTNVAHIQGGDTNVQATGLDGTVNYTYSFNGAGPNPSLAVLDQIMVQKNGVSGIYAVSRNGNNIVIGSLRSSAYVLQADYGLPACKLPGECFVGFEYDNINSGSSLKLNNVSVWSNGTTTTYAFTNSIGGQNLFGAYLNNPNVCGFVTSTGRFFLLPTYYTQGGASSVNVVRGYLPIFTPSTTKTYKATVIGGGGASSGNHGTASSFVNLAAAAGTSRTGFVAGTTVITSGPTAGTGGKGYGSLSWGQGEDTGSAGTYGGGSGYITTNNVTLTGNVTYAYKAGFGPLYGKQGAILLEEV